MGNQERGNRKFEAIPVITGICRENQYALEMRVKIPGRKFQIINFRIQAAERMFSDRVKTGFESVESAFEYLYPNASNLRRSS